MDYRENVRKAMSHLKRGDTIAPPPERIPDKLDAVVEGVIDALPAATRLYPDLYAWIVVDALRASLATENDQIDPKDREEAIEAVRAAYSVAETEIPRQYPKSRALTIVTAMWRIGWRPVRKS